MKLTVYFEGAFWVGVAEETVDGKLKVCRHIFGSEPKDGEVWEFVQRHLIRCMDNAARSVRVDVTGLPPAARINPKRLARLAAAETQRRGVATAAQEALKLELAHRKQERKTLSKERREAEKERKRELARQKAKARHKGR